MCLLEIFVVFGRKTIFFDKILCFTDYLPNRHVKAYAFISVRKIELFIQIEFILKWILLDWGYSGKVKEMYFARLWRCKREKCINFATHI